MTLTFTKATVVSVPGGTISRAKAVSPCVVTETFGPRTTTKAVTNTIVSPIRIPIAIPIRVNTLFQFSPFFTISPKEIV
jgi:hypothetical protein